MGTGRCILSCILLLIMVPATPQTPKFRQYTTADGLPSANVYGLMQDREGYMWFGTENGACRFDGKTFKTFTTKDGLTENLVLSIYQDKLGRIWFITINGHLCYYDKGKIYNPSNNSFLAKLPACGSFWSICEDEQGRLFIAFMGEVLVVSDTGYARIAIRDTGGKPLPVHALSSSVSLLLNRGILYNTKQSLVFYLNDNIIKYEHGEFKYITRPVKKAAINDPFPQSMIGNDLWRTTFRLGVIRIKNCLHPNRSVETYLKDIKVSRVFRDNENNLWFSTIGKGLFMIPGEQLQVRHFNQQNGLRENDVRTLGIDLEGNVWAGAIQNSLYRINNGPLKRYHIPSSVPDYFTETNDICFDNYNHLYLCNVSDLVYYNGEPTEGNARFILFREPGGSPSYGRNFKALTRDTAGNILALTSHRCYVFKPEKNQGSYLMNKIFQSPGDRIYTLLCDSKGIIWLADKSGLNALDKGNNLRSAYLHDSLLREPISRIRACADGNLLLATKTKGVFIFDGKHVKKVFSETNGLASDICNRIFIDHNNVWVATSKGVSHLIYQNSNLVLNRNYTTVDGLLSNEINDMVTQNDTLYVATAEGISILPVSRRKTSNPPPLYIASVFYGNRNLLDSNPGNSRFTGAAAEFNFTGITFQQPEKVQYSYRLLGADDNWKLNTSGTVVYSSLAPGSYTFEVRSKKINSAWSPTRVFHFNIEAPFWLQNWFYISIYTILATTFVLLAYYLSRLNRIKKLKKAELHNRIVQLEQQALGALMNPHFIFNALNSIQQFLLQNDALLANKYLSQFARLTRKNMEAVMKGNVTLEDELDRLHLYLQFEKLRFGDKLKYEIIVPDTINTDELVLPPMILQPFVENAIWHGILPAKMPGEIRVRVNLLDDNLLQVFVEDNGIGIKTDYLNQNILFYKTDTHALSIIAQRLRLINSTVNHQLHILFSHVHPDEQRKGTLVEILLPISRLD